MTFGIIGSGSWATALAKILTDKKHSINWWIRNKNAIDYIVKNNNNPNYLRSAKFERKENCFRNQRVVAREEYFIKSLFTNTI